jgi:hypothetical protein
METIGSLQRDSAAWLFFVRVTFGISVLTTSFGIFFLPVDLWIKGYIAMGLLFTIGSTITLSKTLRDEYEGKKLINKIQEVKTEKMLKEYDLHA